MVLYTHNYTRYMDDNNSNINYYHNLYKGVHKVQESKYYYDWLENIKHYNGKILDSNSGLFKIFSCRVEIRFHKRNK